MNYFFDKVLPLFVTVLHVINSCAGKIGIHGDSHCSQILIYDKSFFSYQCSWFIVMLGGGVGGGVGGGNCREIWHPLLSGSFQLFGPARSDDLWWPAQLGQLQGIRPLKNSRSGSFVSVLKGNCVPLLKDAGLLVFNQIQSNLLLEKKLIHSRP